ncbi:hypothetical protein [Janthinobacterium lividum]|uniref:hypothetical protein n=1 Tax=Janthinobacterium lividum TaxID=29581 RepID=UPI00111472E0|nr:hypothetical protein [Janthinobacterium lividum]
MMGAKKMKKNKPAGSGLDTLEVTRRSIRTTGIRTAVLVVVALVILGIAYIFVNFGRPTTTNFISGDNGTAIGQARDVTISNGPKESE